MNENVSFAELRAVDQYTQNCRPIRHRAYRTLTKPTERYIGVQNSKFTIYAYEGFTEWQAYRAVGLSSSGPAGYCSRPTEHYDCEMVHVH